MAKKYNYFKDDIRKIILLYAIIPVVLLTLVCLFMFWGTWKYHMEKTNRNDNKTISTVVEETVSAYMKLTEELAQQRNIIDGEIDTLERVKIFESIYDTANRLDKKAYLYVFDNELNAIISGTKTVPHFLDGNLYVNWGVFRLMNQNPNKVAIKLVSEENGNAAQIIIGKAIKLDGEIKGYVLFLLDGLQFQISIANQSSKTIITDEYDGVFVTNHYNFINRMNKLDLDIEQNFEKNYISKNSILENRLFIYSITSFNNQTSVFGYITLILLFVFTMMILAAIISSRKIADKKTKDLYAIIRAFEKVKGGNLDTYLSISSNDEFSVIAESYNLMLDSLKEHIEKNKEMVKLVATSQSKQLASQFNPHFLYNTLENIRFMCRLDPKLASEMVFSLSSLLHYSINNNSEEVMVEEDIIYTENYMSILKHRFNKRFNYSIHITSEVKQCIIPKLIIQPMIENAVKHAFEGKSILNIEIKGYIENHNLILTCEDDGVGMKAEVLRENQLILLQTTNTSKHSGLYNIHRRVQLKYGQNYGLQIASKEGLGTCIKIILPIKYEDNIGDKDA